MVRERPITFSGELIVSDREVADLASGVFADTGENMNLKPNAIREKKETDAVTPRWVAAGFAPDRFGPL